VNQELDPVSEAESIIGSDADKIFTVKIPGMVLVELTLHLNMMREMRRRKIGVSDVQEKDEDTLSALETRFYRKTMLEPAPEVEMEISRREMDALGGSLPKTKSVVKLRQRLAPHLVSKHDSEFYPMILGSFRKLNEAFVLVGGMDNPELLKGLERRR
jgi:hypothetical protein